MKEKNGITTVKSKTIINSKQLFFLLILFYPTLSFSQNNQIDSVIKAIYFEKDTIKAVFEWVANNIDYDVEKARFKSKIRAFSHQSDEEKINTALLTKKGVCEDYALIFDNLCKKLGYESYLVDGYTKDLTKIEINFGHAWNVIKIKGKWYCFDPTWSAGSVYQNVFHKAYNDIWFKVPPNEFLFTHVPYDPIWQLTEHPVIAKTNNVNLPISDYFNFEDSISAYKDAKSIKFSQNLINRITKYSDSNDIVSQYIEFLTDNLNVEKYNFGIEKFNRAITIYNSYLFAKSNRFQNPKLSDSEIQDLLDTIKKEIDESKIIVNTSKDKGNIKIVQEINQMINNVEKENAFFQKYKKMKSPFKRFLYRYPF